MASPSRVKNHILHAQADAEKETPSASSASGKATAQGNEDILPQSYMDLGDCSGIQDLDAALQRAAEHENMMESAQEMFLWSLSLHSCMYKSLATQLRTLIQQGEKPSVLVVDFATYAGFDLADENGIPLVVNNPDLINMLSPDVVAPYDFVPGTMTAQSLSLFSGPGSGFGLVARVVYPLARVLIRLIASFTNDKVLHQQLELAGLEVGNKTVFNRMAGRLVLINGFFGLEYSRPVTPNVVLVGPMLNRPWRNQVHQAREEFITALSQEDKTWLELTPSSVPVVWVSMGTISPLNQRQVIAMYAALSQGAREGRFRVLWKLEKSLHQYLPSAADRPSDDQMKIVVWVSSQLGVLAHPHTKVFLSHCGINSVHESVYLEKKLLCIPILADQAGESTEQINVQCEICQALQ